MMSTVILCNVISASLNYGTIKDFLVPYMDKVNCTLFIGVDVDSWFEYVNTIRKQS